MLCFPSADGTISSLSQNGSMHFPCSRSLSLSCERSNVSSEQVIKVFMSLNNKAPHYFAQAKDAVRVPCLSKSNQSAISVMCSSHEPQENTGVITRDPPECERDIPSFGVVTLDQPHMAIEERHMDEKDSFERLSSFDQRVQARADGDQQCDNELLTRDMVSLYTDRTRLVSHHEHVREPSDCGLDADNGLRRLKTGNLGNEVSSSDYIGLKYAVTRSNPPLSEMVNSVSSTNSVLELRSPRTHPDVLATAKIKYMETVNTSSTIRGLASLRMPASRPLSGMNAVGVSYLESIGVNCAKVFERVPTVKTHTLKQIKAIISALEQHGLKISEMGKIINLCPKILLLNPEKDLPKVTSFLFNEVGLPQHHFPKVVRRCPRILVADISEQLRPTLSFVRTLGFLKVGNAIANNPSLLAFDVEKRLLPRLRLIESWGYTYREAADMAVRFPSIFNYSTENLQSKFDYLKHEIKSSDKELLSFPQYFGYSLDKRICPRHECLVKLGLSLPLHEMLTPNDDEFAMKFLYAECVSDRMMRSKIDSAQYKSEEAKVLAHGIPEDLLSSS